MLRLTRMFPFEEALVLRTSRIAMVGALLVAALGSGCSPATSRTASAGTPAPSPAGSRPKIVFDMGHGEIFGPSDTSELGQSQAIEHIQQAGFDVVINQDELTAEDFKDASGLILAGPMRPLKQTEYGAINTFLNRGGTALLTVHVPFPIMAVPGHWGLPVIGGVILSEDPLPGADPSIFLADGIKPGPLTQGVKSILIVSGWPVRAKGRAASLPISTGPDTWIDSNGNGAKEASDSMGPFGVVGTTRVGQGQVVVIGDDAVFANIAIGQADNARLLDNILKLMREANQV